MADDWVPDKLCWNQAESWIVSFQQARIEADIVTSK